MAKEEFPEIKKENQGKFTAWVEKNMGGMDTCKAASKIMRSRTKKYSPAVVKMANYANNFGCKTKKDDGASIKKSRGTKEENKNARKAKRAETKDYNKSEKRTKTINKLIKYYNKNEAKQEAGKITKEKELEKNKKARKKANAKLVSKQIDPLLGS